MSYHVLWGTHGTLVPAVDFIVHRPFLSFARSLKKKFQPKLFEGDWFHVFPCSNSSTSYTKCGSLVHHPQGIPWIPKGSRRDPGSLWMLNQALQGTDRALADLRLVGFRALAPRVSFKEPHEVIPDFMPHPPWDFLGFKMCLIITS